MGISTVWWWWIQTTPRRCTESTCSLRDWLGRVSPLTHSQIFYQSGFHLFFWKIVAIHRAVHCFRVDINRMWGHTYLWLVQTNKCTVFNQQTFYSSLSFVSRPHPNWSHCMDIWWVIKLSRNLSCVHMRRLALDMLLWSWRSVTSLSYVLYPLMF